MAVMPIPQDWDGAEWCCYVVDWPKSQDWQSILAGLLLNPTSGRFWDGATGSIVDAQEVGAMIEARNCIFQEDGSMGCLEDIQLAISNINLAIYNTRGGCGGSGGSGISAQVPSSFIDDGSDFPSGYDDRSAYELAKCNLSQFVIDRMLRDLDALKTVNVAGKAAQTLAGLIPLIALTPIPLDDMLALVIAAILGLAAAGIAAYTTALEEIKSRIEAMDICLIYEAATVDAAVSAIHDWIAGGTYSLQFLTVQLGQGLVGTDAVNVVFSDSPEETMNLDELPTGDCSSCGDICPIYVFEVGSEDGEPYHFASSLTGANYSLSVQLNSAALDSDGPWCGAMPTFRISFAGWSIWATDPIMKIWNDDDAPFTLGSATEYTSTTALPSPSTEFTGRQFAFNSATPFTAIVTLV